MAQTPQELYRRFQEAFNAHDPGAVTALYEPGGLLLLEGRQCAGHAAIREGMAAVLATRPVMQLDLLSALESGDGLALTQGRWTITASAPDGSEMRMAGRNAEIIRRQPDGTWKFVLDNPDAPE